MDWKKLPESITKSVDEELRLRNEYLLTENRILRQRSPDRVQMTDSDRHALARIGRQLGKQAFQEIATVVKPDTLLAVVCLSTVRSKQRRNGPMPRRQRRNLLGKDDLRRAA